MNIMRKQCAMMIMVCCVLTIIDVTSAQRMGIRRNIATMTDDEVRALSFKIIQHAVTFGRYHGYDLWLCPHGSINFLPWHRRLITDFEAAIGEPLPFWDWRLGVPRQLTEQTLGLTTGLIYNRTFNTTRGIIDQNSWPIDAARLGVRNALSKRTFREFSDALESVHATPHVRLGGVNPSTRYSGYDPAFWFNHCFVDGVWAYWQSLHLDDEIPDDITDRYNRAALNNTMRWNISGGQMKGLSVQNDDENRSNSAVMLPDFNSECAPKESLVLVVQNVTMQQDARHIKYVYHKGNESVYLTEFATFGMGRPMNHYPTFCKVEVIIADPIKYFPRNACRDTIMMNLSIIASDPGSNENGLDRRLSVHEYVRGMALHMTGIKTNMRVIGFTLALGSVITTRTRSLTKHPQ